MPLVLHRTFVVFELATYGATGSAIPPRPLLMRIAMDLGVFRSWPRPLIALRSSTVVLAVLQRRAQSIRDPLSRFESTALRRRLPLRPIRPKPNVTQSPHAS